MNTKNIILDKPFKEDVPFILSKGEKILWEGFPIYHKEYGSEKLLLNLPQSFRKKFETNLQTTILYFFFIIFVAVISDALTINIFIAILVTVIMLSILLSFPDLYFSYKRINTTAYILTSKQMIFKFGERVNKQVHAVPLNQIRDITFQRNTDHPESGFIVLQ